MSVTGARAVPIHQTASYVLPDTDTAAALFNMETPGHVYSRLSNPTVAAAFSQALGKAFETKGRMDRNMQTLLALLNLPSRADVHRLVTKLEAVQGSLVNLNLKVDRLLA